MTLICILLFMFSSSEKDANLQSMISEAETLLYEATDYISTNSYLILICTSSEKEANLQGGMISEDETLDDSRLDNNADSEETKASASAKREDWQFEEKHK